MDDRKFHVTCETTSPTHEIRQWTVYAADPDSAIAEARIILGEDRIDSKWTVRPATDNLPYNTSYVDYLFNNGKRHTNP